MTLLSDFANPPKSVGVCRTRAFVVIKDVRADLDTGRVSGLEGDQSLTDEGISMLWRKRRSTFTKSTSQENKRIDVAIISSGLLEPGSNRGGGCEISDFNVARQLSKEYNVVLVGPYFGEYSSSASVNEHFSVEYVPFPALGAYPLKSKIQLSLLPIFLTLFYSVAVAIKMIGLVKRGLKIVVVHSPYSAALALAIAKLTGRAVVFSEGNITPWYDPSTVGGENGLSARSWRALNLALSKSMCLLSDRIRSQSASIRDAMIGFGIDSEKIEVIPAGENIDRSGMGSRTSSESHSSNVAFIGRLTEEKGVPLLLEICQKSKWELPETRFHIFGDGPYRDLFLGMPNVAHLGSVARNELFERLAHVQIVLSFQKELGRAEIECLAAGKALIACNIGEIPHIIHDEENGILCNPDSNSYVEAIRRVQQDRALREGLSKGAIATAVEYFDWDLIGIRWRTLCKGIMSKPFP